MKKIGWKLFLFLLPGVLAAQQKNHEQGLTDEWSFEQQSVPEDNAVHTGGALRGHLSGKDNVHFSAGIARIKTNGRITFKVPALAGNAFTVWLRFRLEIPPDGDSGAGDTTGFIKIGGLSLARFQCKDRKGKSLWGITGNAGKENRVIPGIDAVIGAGSWVQIAVVKDSRFHEHRVRVYYREEAADAPLVNWIYIGRAELSPGLKPARVVSISTGPAGAAVALDELKCYNAPLAGQDLLAVWPSLGGVRNFPPKPYGAIIDHAPASSGRYIAGAPSIVVLDNGIYLAKGDDYGPAVGKSELARVYQSLDKGRSWTEISQVEGITWATLFQHKGIVYMLGTSAGHGLGHVVIMRSSDGGVTWTKPVDTRQGLIRPDLSYHTAPTPVIIHNGRIWRSMEDEKAGGGWGKSFRAMIMSAPIDSDLLNATNWIFSDNIGYQPEWLDGKCNGILEGNIAVAPNGELINLLRVSIRKGGGKAAFISFGKDGSRPSFDPGKDFIPFPGGSTKFHVLYDSVSRKYWALSNAVLAKHRDDRSDESMIRNTLVLMNTDDLRNWHVLDTVLYHPDIAKHSFQYPSFVFDGKDIVFVSRTAYDDGVGGAFRQHDANYFTFHRIKDFRKLDRQRPSVVKSMHK